MPAQEKWPGLNLYSARDRSPLSQYAPALNLAPFSRSTLRDKAAPRSAGWLYVRPHQKSARGSFDNLIYCSYSKAVRVGFDPAKDSANQAKHGVSLSMANDLDWEAALVWVDERFEYREA